MTANLPNVTVDISPHASPITATYDFIGKDGPLSRGTEVILGVSTKGGDAQRFKEAPRYVKNGVQIRDLQSSAVEPKLHSGEYMGILNVSPLKENMPSIQEGRNPAEFHASDMRYLLGEAANNEDAIELLEDFVGPDNIFDVLSLLGLTAGLQEISSMAGGSGEGSSGPWDSDEIRRGNKKERQDSKLTTRENIDLTMIDEVMRLIIERGIRR